MTQHFMVIGNPICHSQSPRIHHNFAKQVGIDIRYARQYCPDDTASFTAVVRAFFNGGGGGANVTVPFKQRAFDLCLQTGDVSADAAMAGAVNTLMIKKLPDTVNNANELQLYGDNTDGRGLVLHLKQLGWLNDIQKVAIIGAGGATRGVILPLLTSGVTHLTIANRTVAKAKNLLTQLQNTAQSFHSAPQPNQNFMDVLNNTTLEYCTIEQLNGNFDLIINATSTGLDGTTLPLASNLYCRYAYDMVYGKPLPFLQHFAKLQAKTSDGFGMLVAQAALSFELWTQHAVDIKQSMNDLS